jgi:hypothetical protein
MSVTVADAPGPTVNTDPEEPPFTTVRAIPEPVIVMSLIGAEMARFAW